MTCVYFVRHCQSLHPYADERTRPLTQEGQQDTDLVLETLKEKAIDLFYCSPYRRSLDTIHSSAEYYGIPIHTDERLRERESGAYSNNREMFRRRWEDLSFHEEGGESIRETQQRNIAALTEILNAHPGKNIVIGTHGTALSAILNYYLPAFGLEDFLRILDWMPYIIRMDFEGTAFLGMEELAYREKAWQN